MRQPLLCLSIAVGIALLMLLGWFEFSTAASGEESPSHLSRDALAKVHSSEIVVSSNPGANKQPAVVYNSDNDEFLVIWRSQQTNGYDIRGQLVNVSGILVGQDFTITTPISTSWPRLPAVAYNSTHKEFLVVWSDEISKSLHGQRVLTDGVLIGSPFTISTPLNDDPHSPALVYAPDDDVFLLAWRGCVQNQVSIVASPDGGGGSCYFYTQVLDGTGVEISENITATASTYMQVYPALTYVPGLQEFWIVWTEQHTIAAQCILTTGLLFGEPFTVAQGTTEMFNPSISGISSQDEFLVAWENRRDIPYQSSSPMGGGYRDIYAQRILSSGIPVSDSFRVSRTSTTAIDPKAIYLSERDQYFVVWVSVTYPGYDIYARWISATGELVGCDFPAVVAPECQENATVTGNNTAFIVWQDSRGGPDIRGRFLEMPSWIYLPMII